LTLIMQDSQITQEGELSKSPAREMRGDGRKGRSGQKKKTTAG